MHFSLSKPILLLLWLSFCCSAFAQGQDLRTTVSGVVLDRQSLEPISNVIITFHTVGKDDSLGPLIAYTSSRDDGTFSVSLSKLNEPIWCRVRLMGYFEKKISLSSLMLSTPLNIYLKSKQRLLPEVVVMAKPIQARGDTIFYRASAFLTPNTYSAEDLIKKLPGVGVGSDGLIRYLGEPIQGVYIEGVDLVADHYQTATRIVKAEDIKSVEVIERFQKVKVLKGVRAGDGALLNLRLKNPDMLNPSGSARVGVGTLAKKLLMQADANALLVNSRTQILSSFDIGNTNQEPPQNVLQAQSIPQASVRHVVQQRVPTGVPSIYFLKQQRAEGTFNQLIRLKQETTLKYNLGYQNLKQEKSGGQKVLLYNGTGYTNFEDRWRHDEKSQQAFLSLDYTHNGEKKYIQNQFNIQGDHLNAHKNLDRREVPIHEMAKIGELRLSDQFNYMQKNDGSLLMYNGQINYRNLPRAYVGVPEGAFFYEHAIRGQDLMAKTGFSYGWNLTDQYSLDGSVKLEGQYQDGEILSDKDDVISQAKGGKVFCATGPTLNYKGSQLNWSLSIPLELLWNNYDYLDFEKERKNYNKVRLYPGVNLTFFYRPVAAWEWKLFARFKNQETSDYVNYLLGSYHTSFESELTRRELLIPELSSLSVGLNIQYKRPIQGFFSKLSLMGKRNEGNNVTHSVVRGTSKEAIIVKEKRIGHNIIGQFYFSKQLMPIHTLLTYQLDYNYLDRPLVISKKRTKLAIHSLSSSADINTRLFDGLELNASVRYNLTRLQSGFANNRVDEFSIEGGIIFNMAEYFSAKVHNESFFTKHNGEPYPTRSIFNTSLVFRQPKYHVDLKCENLLNEKLYFTSRNTDADQYHIYNSLRQRQVVLSFMHKF